MWHAFGEFVTARQPTSHNDAQSTTSAIRNNTSRSAILSKLSIKLILALTSEFVQRRQAEVDSGNTRQRTSYETYKPQNTPAHHTTDIRNFGPQFGNLNPTNLQEG